MPVRDFNALVEQMSRDIEETNRRSRGAGGERRAPVMT
jgi:hypothetical protein